MVGAELEAFGDGAGDNFGEGVDDDGNLLLLRDPAEGGAVGGHLHAGGEREEFFFSFCFWFFKFCW